MQRGLLMLCLAGGLATEAGAQVVALRAGWSPGGAPAVLRVGPGYRFAWSGGGGFRFGVWRGGPWRGPLAGPGNPVVFVPWAVVPWSDSNWNVPSPPLGTTTLAGREIVPLVVPNPVSFREFTP